MIAEQNGIARDKSTEFVKDLIEIIKSTLESGEAMLVSGSDLMLSARKVVTFKCSGKLWKKMKW
jgi:integration host factor subunit alpha